jgi:PKD repeat protein
VHLSRLNGLSGISTAGAAVLLLITLLPCFTPTRADINAGFSDWKYHLPIYIVNHNSYEIVNYDAKIIIDTKKLITSGITRADCGDIRFSDGNGKSLPYWIQPNTCDTEKTIIWVKIPYLAPNSTNIIYMYYGNPKATDESNAYEVFLFFDDFQGTSLNTKRWSIIFEPSLNAKKNAQIHYPTFNVNNGLVVNVPDNCYYYVFIPNFVFSAPVVAEMYFRIINYSKTSNFITNTILTETNSSAWYFGNYEEFGDYGYWSSSDWGLPVDTNWHLKTMIIEDGNQTSYLDGQPVKWWGRISKTNPTGISIKFKTGDETWNHIAVEIKFFLIATYSRNVEVLLTPVTNIGKAPVITLYDPQVSGLTVTVNGVASPGYSGASITRIHWDWGDNSGEDHWFPASHKYSKSGTYTVTVTVYQSDGLSASKTITVKVEAPSFDFSVSTRGTSFSVARGDSITVPVSVSLIEGTPSKVSLSLGWITEGGGGLGASNQWLTTEFNPSSGTPPFDSALTIKVAENAPTGIYKAQIFATGGGKAKYTMVTVNIVPALEIIGYSTLVENVSEDLFYKKQPAIPEKVAAPSGTPHGIQNVIFSPGTPTQNQYFILNITVKNNRNSPLTIPGTLSHNIVLPKDSAKFDVNITGPQLVEVIRLSGNSVGVGKALPSISLGPGEIKSLYYLCEVRWRFSTVSFSLNDIVQAFIEDPDVLSHLYEDLEKTVGEEEVFKILGMRAGEVPAKLSEIEEELSSFNKEALSAERGVGVALNVIMPFANLAQLVLDLKGNLAFFTVYTFSFPSLTTKEGSIPVTIVAQKRKIDAFWQYIVAQPVVDAVSIGLSGTLGAFFDGPGIVAGIIAGVAIESATDAYYINAMHDPSLNYTRLVPAPSVPGAFSRLPNSTESRVLLYEYLYLAYLNASAESMARANGAREMNDTKYYYLQLRNAQVYAANASIYYSRLVPLLEQIIEELDRSGYLSEASFIKGKEDIAKNGLPSNVTRLLEELGFTKYINIREVEEKIKNARYEPLNVTAFKEALELSKKYNPAAFFNQSFAEELESVSNKTLCQVVLNVAGPSNITVKVDGRDYPLPSSLYLNLGTKHNVTFAQVVPGLFQDYVFKELIVGNQTYTDPSIQLTVLEPVSVTAIYEARPSALTITIIALALLAATAAAYTIRRKHRAKPPTPS